MKKLIFLIPLLLMLVGCQDKTVYVDGPRYNQVKLSTGSERGSLQIVINALNSDTDIYYVLLEGKVDTLDIEEIKNPTIQTVDKGSVKGIVNKTIKDLGDDKEFSVFAVMELNGFHSEVIHSTIRTMTEAEALIQGDGSEENPFIISEAWQLALITTGEYGFGDDNYYELANDIDLLEAGYNSENPWVPIGKQNGANRKFGGVFNGNGYTIRNLVIRDNGGTEKWGLFQETKLDGIIHDLHFDGVDINVEGFRIATVVGYSKGSLYNVTVKNANIVQPTGEGQVGGIVGAFYESGAIIKASFHGDIKADGRRVGGIVGAATSSGGYDQVSISDVYFEGSITGSSTLSRQYGGVLGAGSGVAIRRSLAKADIKAVRQVGGVVGYNEGIAAYDAIHEDLVYLGGILHADGSDGNTTVQIGMVVADIGISKGDYQVSNTYADEDSMYTSSSSNSSRRVDGTLVNKDVFKTMAFYEEFLPNFNFINVWALVEGIPTLKIEVKS